MSVKDDLSHKFTKAKTASSVTIEDMLAAAKMTTTMLVKGFQNV